VLGAAKRTFGIDYPIRAKQRAEKGRERLRLLEMVQTAVKSELACSVDIAQARHELAAEHAAENFHRQEEIVPSWDPAAVVRGQAAGRDDAVDVRNDAAVFDSRCAAR
jgi:cation transport regulator ChaC